MRKLLCVVVTMVIILFTLSCGRTVNVTENILLSGGEISSVSVSSLPEGYNFEFRSSEEIQKP